MNLILPMIKEEWRMHSTLFGGMFGVFPLMILCSTFLGALLHPYYSMIIPERQMLLIISYLFVMFGASAGGFGLLGREAMNRRFGQSSLIAYSSRTLPVSEKQIFSAFFVKEILYYIAYWTLPFVGGFFFASFFIGYPAATSMHLFISLTLSFLLGLTVSFVLSTIFVNTNKRLFSAVFVVLLTIAYIYQDKLSSLPSFQYMITKDMTQLLGSLGFVGIGSVVSILSMKIDFPVPKKLHENSLGDWPVYMTKDIIDLWRSEGGIGKIVFSLVIPAFLIWEILDIFNAYVIRIDFVVFFAIFFSILSASIYNWLTEFDTFTNYTYLPAGIGTIISEKFRTFLLLNSISFAILLAAAVIKGEYGSLLPAALCLLGLSVWSASTIVLIGGLSPNVMLYDPKIFIAYIALNLPFVLAAMIGSLFATWYVALSVLLVLPAWLLVKAGIHRAML